MLDESKAIKAKEIVDNPESVYSLMREYVMLSDSSVNATFGNLMDAIDIFSQAGWEVINMAYASYMFVILRNRNYKNKNQEL